MNKEFTILRLPLSEKAAEIPALVFFVQLDNVVSVEFNTSNPCLRRPTEVALTIDGPVDLQVIHKQLQAFGFYS